MEVGRSVEALERRLESRHTGSFLFIAHMSSVNIKAMWRKMFITWCVSACACVRLCHLIDVILAVCQCSQCTA